MKKELYILVLIAYFVASACGCKKPVELARYELLPQEIALIPYEKGQKIKFKHSNGYEFLFEVTEDNLEWKEDHKFTEMTFCSPNYWSYQQKNVKLQLSYPNISFDLSIKGRNNERFYSNDSIYNSLNINMSDSFSGSFSYDSVFNILAEKQNIVINGIEYQDVIKIKLNNNSVPNPTLTMPEYLLYNTEFGILQFNYTDNENYTLVR